jgi:hypothetical protein
MADEKFNLIKEMQQMMAMMKAEKSPISTASFAYRDYKCETVFGGHPGGCGYVFLPEGHSYFGKSYDDLGFLNCHGGLTFAAYSDAEYKIGFDMRHFCSTQDSIDGVSYGVKVTPEALAVCTKELVDSIISCLNGDAAEVKEEAPAGDA